MPLSIYINSNQRASGTHSNFMYPVQLPDLGNRDSESVRAVILSASIPKTYYTVDAENNTFTLIEEAKEKTITLPVGFYSASLFQTAVQTALNNNTMTGKTYTVTFTSLTA